MHSIVHGNLLLDGTLNDMWYVSYSPTQKCFHVDEIKDLMPFRIDGIKKREMPDYLIFGIYKTMEEAHEGLRAMEDMQLTETGVYIEAFTKDHWAVSGVDEEGKIVMKRVKVERG